VIADAIRLDNIALRRGRNGALYLSYPNKLTTKGDRYPYFNPISQQAAQTVQDAVLARLAKLAKSAAEGTAQAQ